MRKNTERKLSRILVVTIGTGKYMKYIGKLLDSLVDKFPGKLLTVHIIGDEIDLFYEKEDYMFGNGIKLEYSYVENLPWPLVTCLKFMTVSEMLKKRADLQNFESVLYLDAVMRVQDSDKFRTLPFDKITLWNHFIWDSINEQERIELHNKNENSLSFLKESERKQYVHAGMFFGNPHQVISFCDTVQDLMNKELRNYTIPTWHDESCLNYIYHKHPEHFNVVEHEVFDEDAPKRYPRPVWEYMLSFENCHDCQKEKEV